MIRANSNSTRLARHVVSRGWSPRGQFFGLVPRFSIVMLTAMTLATTSMSSHALRVQRLSLEQLQALAETVVLGRVTAETTRLGPRGKATWTDYTFEIAETLAGVERGSSGSNITVSFVGGDFQGRSMGIGDAPKLEAGTTYLLYLLADERYAAATVGWGQGIFRLVETEMAGAKREVFVSADGETLETGPDGRLRRGPRVTIDRQTNELSRAERRKPVVQRSADPVVYNADGSQRPLTPQKTAARSQRVEWRNYASLEEVRRFLQQNDR